MKTYSIKHETIKNMVDCYTSITSFAARVILFVPKCDLTAEDIATLQAMYSRSNKSIIKKLLDLLEQVGLDKTKGRIIGQTFKGYGHKSIGDLGHMLICYEGVSMLAAKAIQDSQLYAGQEASTRYIPFDKQSFLFVGEDGKLYRSSKGSRRALSKMQERSRNFYLRILPIVQEQLFKDYPWEEQAASKWRKSKKRQKAFGDYERAIKARAFDIVRGFLPAGCSTNLAWWTSITHAGDHLGRLRCHTLAEVRELARASEKLLRRVYPTSFKGKKVYPEREEYKTNFYNGDYYLIDDDKISPTIKQGHFAANMWPLMLNHWKGHILRRPKGQDLPYQIGECGVVLYEALLDFASFRDQQRHRPVTQRQGLITAKYGFHPWYIENLPESIRNEAIEYLTNHLYLIGRTTIQETEKQYLFPMGMRIPTRIVGPLDKVVYMVELRAQTTVHPTYHANAYDFAQRLQEYLSQQLEVESVPLYVNPKVGEFSWKRGTQTILVGNKAISDE